VANDTLGEKYLIDSTPIGVYFDFRNTKLLILDKNGKFLGEYREFSRVSGLAIDRNDTI